MIPPMADSPPFAGIASFFKAPYLADPRSADADVAILGIPYDEATTARPGAATAPGPCARLDELGLSRRRRALLRR